MNSRPLLLTAAAASPMANAVRAQVDSSDNWQTMNHGFNGWVIAAPSAVLYGAVAPGVCDNFGIGDSLVGSGIGLDIARSTEMAPALAIGAAPKAGQKPCVTAALNEAGVNPGTGNLEVGIHELAGETSINLQ